MVNPRAASAMADALRSRSPSTFNADTAPSRTMRLHVQSSAPRGRQELVMVVTDRRGVPRRTSTQYVSNDRSPSLDSAIPLTRHSLFSSQHRAMAVRSPTRSAESLGTPVRNGPYTSRSVRRSPLSAVPAHSANTTAQRSAITAIAQARRPNETRCDTAASLPHASPLLPIMTSSICDESWEPPPRCVVVTSAEAVLEVPTGLLVQKSRASVSSRSQCFVQIALIDPHV